MAALGTLMSGQVTQWAMLAAALSNTSVMAGGGPPVVREVEVLHREQCTVVAMEFAHKMRYVRHVPGREGEDLIIQLQPTDLAEGEAPALKVRQHARARHGGALIDDVEFDGAVDGGPFLKLSFNAPVAFAVRQGGDLTSLAVFVRPQRAARGRPIPAHCP